MKFSQINWINDGWTVIQDADAEKHVLEISCFAKDGQVTEIRKRHNDGEEEKLTKKINDEFALPMSLEAFKKAVEAGKINLK